MNIFLIRHGQSIENAGYKTETLKDFELTLTERGREQALQCGKLIKQYCVDNDIKLEKSIMFSSFYIRAQQTATLINATLNIKHKLLYPLCEYQKGINIRDFRPQNNMKLLKTYESSIKNIDLNETPYEIVLRARQTIEYIKSLNYKNVFIVSHYGFIKAFDIAFLNKSLDSYYGGIKSKNCSIRQYYINGNDQKYIGEIQGKDDILNK